MKISLNTMTWIIFRQKKIKLNEVFFSENVKAVSNLGFCKKAHYYQGIQIVIL